MTAALVVSLVVAFGLVAFHVFLVESQFRLERLETRLEEERQTYGQLRLEAARLKSPERILRLARERFGMTDPEAITYLTVRAPVTGDEVAEEAGGPAGEVPPSWAAVKPIVAAKP